MKEDKGMTSKPKGSPEHNRVELDPPASTQPKTEQAAPPEPQAVRRADDG